MTFLLFVEGVTEAKVLSAFFKKWLDPRLDKPVRINVVKFHGEGDLYKDVRKKALMHLEGPKKHEITAVISLLDLYGPKFFPSEIKDVMEKCKWGKQHIESLVDHDKFVQFFAVHELEAWLLSEPSIFPREIQKALPKQPPETINGQEPPSKLLKRLYTSKLNRDYKKVVDGNALFAQIDPATARQQCPNLRLLLDKMLQLAAQKPAGKSA